MSSLFGRFKAGTGPNATSLVGSPNRKSAAQTPSTPLEKWLVETGPGKGDGRDKFFGMHNASNTCYCNSVVQCLYFSEPFRDQVINFPRVEHRQPISQTDLNNSKNGASLDNTAANGTEPQGSQKQSANTTNSSQANQPEIKESFDYQKKLALAAGPNLRLEQDYSQSYGMPESLFTSLKDLFESIIAHESQTGIVTPSKFLEVLKRNHEIFRSNVHQDAHEFLNILLNEVVEQVEAHSKSAVKGPGHTAGLGLSMPSQQLQPQQNGGQPTSSWVHELFEGTLTSETRCLTCENVSQRDEAFLDLSVDLEEHSSVTSCLKKFSEEEMLCERNKFHCDQCSGLQEAEKRMKIKRLPRILALHLKRFKFVEEIGNFRKLFHRVVYPFHLRLLNTTDDAEDPDRLYELYGVVVHLGATPFHGHYVSIIKTKTRGWLLFDDELVLPVTKEYVRNFFGGDQRNPACAYVLFYQETTIEEVQREQETEDFAVSNGFEVMETATENSGASPTLTADTAPTPGGEEPDAFATLEHAATAPAIPDPVTRPSYEDTDDDDLTALPIGDRAPSFEERSPLRPQGVPGKGLQVPRLRQPGSGSNSSTNRRSFPKLWGSRDRSSTVDAALVEEGDTLAPLEGITFPTNKPERSRSTKFGLGRKKTT